jgi:NADPH:quinone reductase-like Zn-dependent oxidoreductase
MKVFEIGDQQGIASLTEAERPDPVPGPGEAVLRVRAACLNHRDLLIVSGRYGPRRPASRVPLSDGIGEVLAVGPGVGPGVGPAVGPGVGGPNVSGITVGDRAMCGHFVTWIDGAFSPSVFATDLGVTADGWLAERIVVPAAALVPVPATLTDERAVALGAAGLTAWNALVEIGRVKSGDLVLTLGTGGVSIFALQLAKLHGANVAITSSDDAKLAQASRLGAGILLNYRTTPDWAAALLAATGGRGADIIVETGGLATLSQSIAAAAPNARIVLIGALAGMPDQVLPNFSSIIGKNLTLRGITAGNRRMLAELVRSADLNGLVPVIDRVFPFEQAPAAYAHLQSGTHIGKVMIALDSR